MMRASWPTAPGDESRAVERTSGSVDQRVHGLLSRNYADVWRVLRRLGLPSGSVEDAAQHVFLVASRKLDSIEAGHERSFLIGTAVRVAANMRRAAAVRRERADDEVASRADEAPGPEELLDEKRLRQLLDAVLDSLPDDLRTVLVLFELEELSVTEIAEVVGVPRGTAASRLRRARDAFEASAQRLKAQRLIREKT
jgi:RNA polymerase sigma-70 factor (ECF subfamily)